MSNPGIMLTKQGKMLLAKCILGKTLHFSKVSYGAGDFEYTGDENFLDITELVDKRMDLPIVGKILEGDGTAVIKAALMNFDLEVGFAAKEVGIYAVDPDTDEEILYAYRNAGDEYSFIPANTGPVHKNTVHAYRVEIQSAPNVTFDINFDFAYVSQAEFDDLEKNTARISDEDVEVEGFWAAGKDNTMQKISLADTQKFMFEGDKKRLNFLQFFVQAKEELGLSGNIYWLEDFKPPTLIDDTDITVTLFAKNYNTLRVNRIDGLKLGSEYILTDKIASEVVKIENIDISPVGFTVTLAENVKNQYLPQSLKVVSSDFDFGDGASSAANVQSLLWESADAFTGDGDSLTFEETTQIFPLAENAQIVDVTCDKVLTGNGRAKLRVRLFSGEDKKSEEGWSDWVCLDDTDCMEELVGKICSAVQLKASYSVTVTDGFDSAKIENAIVKFKQDADKHIGNSSTLVLKEQTFSDDFVTTAVVIKHGELEDKNLKAYVNYSEGKIWQEKLDLGTGNNAEQTFTLMEKNIQPDSLKVYVGNAQTKNFSYDAKTQVLKLTAQGGLPITADFYYNDTEDAWQEMELDFTTYSQNFDDDFFATRFVNELDFGEKSARVKFKITADAGVEIYNVAAAAQV